jgi:hypothetical protein
MPTTRPGFQIIATQIAVTSQSTPGRSWTTTRMFTSVSLSSSMLDLYCQDGDPYLWWRGFPWCVFAITMDVWMSVGLLRCARTRKFLPMSYVVPFASGWIAWRNQRYMERLSSSVPTFEILHFIPACWNIFRFIIITYTLQSPSGSRVNICLNRHGMDNRPPKACSFVNDDSPVDAKWAPTAGPHWGPAHHHPFVSPSSGISGSRLREESFRRFSRSGARFLFQERIPRIVETFVFIWHPIRRKQH